MTVRFPTHRATSEKWSILEGKNLLTVGANSFLLKSTTFQKGTKTILTDLPPLKVFLFIANKLHFDLQFPKLICMILPMSKKIPADLLTFI